MHEDGPKEFLNKRSPMGEISKVKDIVDAIVYLTEAGRVSPGTLSSVATMWDVAQIKTIA
jgi:hypothetical protein